MGVSTATDGTECLSSVHKLAVSVFKFQGCSSITSECEAHTSPHQLGLFHVPRFSAWPTLKFASFCHYFLFLIFLSLYIDGFVSPS